MKWKKTNLSSLGEFKNGVNFSSDKLGKGHPLINVKDITDGKFLRSERLQRVNLELPPYSDYFSKEGDIFFVRSSVKRDGAGISGVILTQSEPTVHCGFVIRFRPTSESIHPRFLLYFLHSPSAREELRNLASGATIYNISQGALKQMSVPVPPLSVQHKIANILRVYDKLIENNLRRTQLLEEASFCKYRLMLVEHESDMRSSTLEDVLRLHYGKALKADERVSGDVPVYGSSGIVGTHNKALVEGPGIVVGRKGNVGSVFWEPEPFFPIDTVYYVSSELSLYFLYHNLKFDQHFDNSDAAVPGLNRGHALSNKIKVPPANALMKFESSCKAIFELIHNLRKQNARLREARDILLPRLMSGEISVEEAALEANLEKQPA